MSDKGDKKNTAIEEQAEASCSTKRNVELVSPAGTLEKLKIAIVYGADAVYLSGKKYGLRKHAGNFTMEELKAGVAFAHERNRRVYVGVNIFARNRDLHGLASYVEALADASIDGVIVADPGVLALVKGYLSNVRVHVSTQANVTNWRAAEFWRDLGADRIILSRELTQEEVAEIASRTSAEIEVFVHGAMCVAYSGRCLLSAYLTGRSANLGECAQPCRWSYTLLPNGEEEKPLTIEEDGAGTYLLSSADLCMVSHLKKLIEAGVAAMKIEGRMRSIYYVANATRVYRKALEAYHDGSTVDSMQREWQNELAHLTRRGYTRGFYLGDGARETQEDEHHSTCRNQRFLGLILEDESDGLMKIRAFNKIEIGQTMEIMSFLRKNDRLCTVCEILDKNGERIKKTGAGEVVHIGTDTKGQPNEILRAI